MTGAVDFDDAWIAVPLVRCGVDVGAAKSVAPPIDAIRAMIVSSQRLASPSAASCGLEMPSKPASWPLSFCTTWQSSWISSRLPRGVPGAHSPGPKKR